MTASQAQQRHAQQRRVRPIQGAEYERLVLLWVDLVRRAAQAAAHGSGDASAMEHNRALVEEALENRFPAEWAQVRDTAIEWESTLLHDGTGQRPTRCLHCRRARLGLPADLPFPGGRR